MDALQARAGAVIGEVSRALLGKEAQIRTVMQAFLAGGHVLLEDMPGVGKTTLALAFSRALALDFRRVQFTPDVMPSDLTGFSVYRRDTGAFVYQPGSVFCHLLLADEINRASPRTQSALLEVMEEGRVTVEGVTREVGDPFLVIATQNPAGSVGTQPLPDTQVDRFMVSLSLGYPDAEAELEMAKTVGAGRRTDGLRRMAGREDLLAMQQAVREVYIHDDIYRYILELITATRSHPQLARGASPRATVSMVKMARSAAWLDGRDYVTPADVRRLFPRVTAHRLLPAPHAKAEGVTGGQVAREIAESVKMPGTGKSGR